LFSCILAITRYILNATTQKIYVYI
jgi:hypothetical protein